MHILQPKHSKLKPEEAERLLSQLNISKAQLPKISLEDYGIANLDCQLGDIIKIIRKQEDNEIIYYRVVV